MKKTTLTDFEPAWLDPRNDRKTPYSDVELEVLADAGREAGLAQREVVLPHPDEAIVEAHGADGLGLCHESGSPGGERPNVARGDIAHAGDQQVRVADGLLDDRQ